MALGARYIAVSKIEKNPDVSSNSHSSRVGGGTIDKYICRIHDTAVSDEH